MTNSHTVLSVFIITVSNLTSNPSLCFYLIIIQMWNIWLESFQPQQKHSKRINACTCAFGALGKILAGCHGNPDHQQNARCLKTHCWRHWVSCPSLHAPPSHDASLSRREQISRPLREFWNFPPREKRIIPSIKMLLVRLCDMSKVDVFDWPCSIEFLALVLLLGSGLFVNSPCHLPVARLRSSLAADKLGWHLLTRATVGRLYFTTVILFCFSPFRSLLLVFGDLLRSDLAKGV